MSARREQVAIKDPLRGLREQLTAEYGTAIRPEAIDQVAEEVFAEFKDARIREFVPILAFRRARERLIGLPESTRRVLLLPDTRADIKA